MDFLKKNYEKVILSIVLLGLAVAAAWLLLRVANENSRLEEVAVLDFRVSPSSLEPVDTTTNKFTLQRLAHPLPITLKGTNSLFNPVEWQRRPADQALVKISTGTEVGPGAVVITAVNPLYTIVTYDGIKEIIGAPQHMFSVERQAAEKPSDRRKRSQAASGVGAQTDTFILREMRPMDNPQEFVLEMKDDKTTIVVSAAEPYKGVAGYSADLKYPHDRRTFNQRRVGQDVTIAGESYDIVAISDDSVTLEAKNRKRTTIDFKPSSLLTAQ